VPNTAVVDADGLSACNAPSCAAPSMPNAMPDTVPYPARARSSAMWRAVVRALIA